MKTMSISLARVLILYLARREKRLQPTHSASPRSSDTKTITDQIKMVNFLLIWVF